MGHPVKNGYFSNILTTVMTVSKGLLLTGKHLLQARKSKSSLDITAPDYFQKQQGISTIQFPHESIPVPDTGRYQLHNEIDDCIVCDKCVKICPVNCITIDAIRSPDEFGKTSDGTSKRIYAAKFDIDMGKCCFCGLCTTVCPTECLTMTKNYDFSVFDIAEHNFPFADMTPDSINEKKSAWENHQKAKAAAPAPAVSPQATPAKAPGAVFKPRIKPPENPAS